MTKTKQSDLQRANHLVHDLWAMLERETTACRPHGYGVLQGRVAEHLQVAAEPRPFATLSNEALGAGLHYSFVSLDEYQTEKMHRVNAGRWPADPAPLEGQPIAEMSNEDLYRALRLSRLTHKEYDKEIARRKKSEAEEEGKQPITIEQLAIHRGMVLGENGSYSGADIEAVGLQLVGGCFDCGATIAACNAYPSQGGYWHCEDCIGDQGYDTVEQANAAVFGAVKPCPDCDENDSTHTHSGFKPTPQHERGE